MSKKHVVLWAGGISLALTGVLGGVSQARDETDPVVTGETFTADNVGLAARGHEQSLDSNGGSVGSTGKEAATYHTHGWERQQWNAVERAGDTFLLRNKYNGQCIQAPTELHDPVVLADCNKAFTFQRWIEGTMGGYRVFKLASNHDRAMEATGVDSVVVLATYNAGNTLQQWNVESVN
jgi:hypothetical protein